MTDRRVAELALTSELDSLMMHLPEEFHDAIRITAAEAQRRFDAEVARLSAVRASVPPFETQKERALWVSGNIDPSDRWVAFPAQAPSATEKVAKVIIEGF